MLELNKIYNMDCMDGMKLLPDNSINYCITSPPYWGLRDYGVDGQMGLEKTLDEYINKMVEVFREVKRVLRDDGTLWLNLGDSYSGSGKGGNQSNYGNNHSKGLNMFFTPPGLKPKDLIGIPWRVAFALQGSAVIPCSTLKQWADWLKLARENKDWEAVKIVEDRFRLWDFTSALQADGWYLRQDIIWNKSNCMPESVKDRCTKSHEYIFLLSKSRNYYFDHEAIQEDCVNGDPNPPIEIDVYEGVDRSADNGVVPPVIFDIEYNNLLDGETKNSNTFVKNYAYVGGLDESGNRIIQGVGTETGNSRREIWVDGGDVSDTDELIALGQAALVDVEEGSTYKTTALSGSFIFREDYNLGDVVTVAGQDLRISQVEIIRETGQPKQVFLTFGQIATNTSKQIQSNSSRISNLETKTPGSGSGGASTFNGLIDTPSTKEDQAGKIPQVNPGETALEYKNLGEIINNASGKTTPVDNDSFGLSDSADSHKVKKWSWANIKIAILNFLQLLGFCIRETLTENRTYYTSPKTTAGVGQASDSNDGPTPEFPFLKPQHAVDVAAMLDTAIYNITIDTWSSWNTYGSGGAAIYNLVGTAFILKTAIGAGQLFIIGNSSDQDSARIIGNGDKNTIASNTSKTMKITIRDIQIDGNWSSGIGSGISIAGSQKIVIDGCHIKNNFRNFLLSENATVQIETTNNDLKLGAVQDDVFLIQDGANLDITSENIDTDDLAAGGFTEFFNQLKAGRCDTRGSTYSTTAMPGRKYNVAENAGLKVASAVIPGNTAGVTDSGGEVT